MRLKSKWMAWVVLLNNEAELITARHIISKEIFTLKKISVKDSQAAPKYYALMNESKAHLNL